jgi:hypothetical protein
MRSIRLSFLLIASAVFPLVLLEPMIRDASAAQPAGATGQTEPTILSTSPDGKFFLRRQHAEPTDRGEAQKRVEICTDNGAVLYAWTGGLGSTTVLWSPDARLLALNDMPGEGGDLLRIFSLDPVKISVTPLREPDGNKLRAEAESRRGTFLSRIERVNLRALEWRDGRLWCQLDGFSTLKRQQSVHVPFHDLWVYGVQGTNSPEVIEEWARTLPKEIPYRDRTE